MLSCDGMMPISPGEIRHPDAADGLGDMRIARRRCREQKPRINWNTIWSMSA